MKTEHQCWHFVMSSFTRMYGIPKVNDEESFHAFALEWCDDHNYSCDILCDMGLNEVDVYFRKEYENWKNK